MSTGHLVWSRVLITKLPTSFSPQPCYSIIEETSRCLYISLENQFISLCKARGRSCSEKAVSAWPGIYKLLTSHSGGTSCLTVQDNVSVKTKTSAVKFTSVSSCPCFISGNPECFLWVEIPLGSLYIAVHLDLKGRHMETCQLLGTQSSNSLC